MKNKKVNVKLERRFVETALSSFDRMREAFAKNAATEKAAAEKAAAEKATARKRTEAKRIAGEEAATARRAAAVQAAKERSVARRAAVEKAEAKREAAWLAGAGERAATEKANAERAAAERAIAERAAAERAASARAAHKDRRIKEHRAAYLEPERYIDDYYPYKNGKNPKWNKFSSDILSLKCSKSDFRGRIEDYFVSQLEPIVPRDCLIICFPSSNPADNDRGINEIARKLCEGGLRQNADGNLHRITKIKSSHNGGNRDITIHRDSISVKEPSMFLGKNVVLLDDITTTGSSFRAAGEILHECGARSITPIALGLTFNEYG
jgi:hypothetical protein